MHVKLAVVIVLGMVVVVIMLGMVVVVIMLGMIVVRVKISTFTELYFDQAMCI